MSWSHQPLVKVRKQVGWHAAPVHWCSDSLFLSLISIFTAACFGPASVTDDHSTQCSCPADVVPLRPQTCLFCSQFILPPTLSIAMRKREKQAVEVWDCVLHLQMHQNRTSGDGLDQLNTWCSKNLYFLIICMITTYSIVCHLLLILFTSQNIQTSCSKSVRREDSVVISLPRHWTCTLVLMRVQQNHPVLPSFLSFW